MFEVQGKVALITGGAQGIGYCIARELLENGVKGVALLDVDDVKGKIAVEKLTSQYDKDSVIFIKTDVTQRSQFEDAFEKTIRTFDHLDIVVNNAGIIHELQWGKCIAVNFEGCVTGSLLALDKYFPACLSTGEGIILNIASVLGIFPAQESPVYSGTKAGIVSFSRALSGPLRSHNLKVKVLTVCPGATRTSILRPTTEKMPQELLDAAARLAKIVEIQSAGNLACHVVSIIKEGNTGTVWAVDGNIRTRIEFSTNFNYPQSCNL